MKRILLLNFVLLITLIVPLLVASGQDVKREQKIKVIIDDGSGTKVIIDTVYKNNSAPDSIKLRDGSTVYIKHMDDRADSRHHRGNEHVIVTYAGDDKNDRGKVKEIRVFSSDSMQIEKSGDGDKVYFYSNSDDHGEGRTGGKYKVITRSSASGGDRDEVVYINKGKSDEDVNGKTFDVYVTKDDNSPEMEKTRFVIAKDGMVVTVEGNDEAKAKELAKLIEQNLGVNINDKGKKEPVKTESQKKVRK
jgi:hypothetical protein